MNSYTYGSVEGVQALKGGLLASPGKSHYIWLSRNERKLMANALETASFAGKPWFESYFGLGADQSGLWHEYLGELDLGDDDMIALVDALALAMDLGDEFAGSWLSGLGECVDVEWI